MTALELKDLEITDPTSPMGMEWDQLVLASNSSGFMQSSHWAKFKRQMGFSVLHLALFANQTLVGGAVFYTGTNNKGVGLLVAPDGPVLPWDNSTLAEQGMQLLIDRSRDYAERLGIMAMRIAPRLSAPKPDALRAFGPSPLNVIESKTMYLDLKQDSTQMLARMKPKGRYNIGLAQRNGVTIREESTISATHAFYKVMREVAARDNFSSEPLSHFAALTETLCPAGLARVFFAEHEGDTLGALLMITFGNRATYLYGGTTNTKRNLMGGYALQWAAITAARESGCEVYDFWGFDPTVPTEHAYAGFSRFKSQFNGEAINLIGTHDYYFVDHLADAVIRAMKEIQLV